jgi:hypothetical protein
MNNRPHWLDDPRNVQRLWRGFLAVLVLTVLAELLLTLHPHFEVEALFGFHAGFGFIACALMILVAKALALLLKRPDTYYAPGDDD